MIVQCQITNRIRNVAAMAIVAAAMALYVYFLFHYRWTDYEHDARHHLNYILYVAGYMAPPPPSAGFEFYQPFFYYLLMALLFKFGAWLGIINLTLVIRAFSLVCYMGFLYFAYRTLARTMSSRIGFCLALAFIAFVPTGVMMSSRINNDIPLYWFYSGAFYYLVLWYQQSRPTDLGRAMIWSGLAVATKTNGLIPCLLSAVVAAMKLWKRELDWKLLRNSGLWVAVAVTMLLCASNLSRSLYYYFTEGVPVVVGNRTVIYDNDPGGVANHFSYLVTFDLPAYLDPPYYDVFNDASGREYFWDAMLKTSLYDEFNLHHDSLASFINLMYLLLILYTVIPLPFLYFEEVKRPPWLSLALLSLAIPLLLLLVRARMFGAFGLACTQEFRYIHPAIVPFWMLWETVVEAFRERGRTRWVWIGWGLAGVLVVGLVALDVVAFTGVRTRP